MEKFKAEFEALDDRFAGYGGDEYVEVLHRGSRKTEGPAYFAAGRYLVWSDIPNDRLLRWDETTGAVGVFRHSSGYANGNTVDRQGRLLTCEQGSRRVTRTEHDGSITVLADSFEGKKLNSPNDIVEHRTDRSGSPIPAMASPPTTRETMPRARSAPTTCTGSTPPVRSG